MLLAQRRYRSIDIPAPPPPLYDCNPQRPTQERNCVTFPSKDMPFRKSYGCYGWVSGAASHSENPRDCGYYIQEDIYNERYWRKIGAGHIPPSPSELRGPWKWPYDNDASITPSKRKFDDIDAPAATTTKSNWPSITRCSTMGNPCFLTVPSTPTSSPQRAPSFSTPTSSPQRAASFSTPTSSPQRATPVSSSPSASSSGSPTAKASSSSSPSLFSQGEAEAMRDVAKAKVEYAKAKLREAQADLILACGGSNMEYATAKCRLSQEYVTEACGVLVSAEYALKARTRRTSQTSV